MQDWRVESMPPIQISPIRITAVISSLGLGGAQRVIVRLCDSLAQRGHSVTLLTTDPLTADFFLVPNSVARVRAHPDAHMSSRWYDLRRQGMRTSALRRCLVETQPDVVVSFIDTTNVGVLLALIGKNIPVIVSERSDPRRHSIGFRWGVLRRLTYPRARRVVFLTEELGKWGRSRWPRWRADVIPNPVMPAAGQGRNTALRADRRTVLGMGRLDSKKRFDLLVRAFALSAGECPDWDLEIVGDGPDRQPLLKLIQELGVSDRVRLPGPEKQSFLAFDRCDLYVLASEYEGFPNALAEAMAAGLPVISFDCPSGPREIVRHEVDGLLVPPLNVEALAAAMGRLMRNPAERSRLASRAPEVVGRFSPKLIFDRWDRLIHEVIEERA